MATYNTKDFTCCFTGHRHISLNKLEEIEKQTEKEIRFLIENKNVNFFGVGGAIGFDTLVSKILFRLKETEFPHIRIILVYPFEGFTNRWTSKQKSDYEFLLSKYDKTVCISEKATKEAYLNRNRHLVDFSAYCIGYCTRDFGGSSYTLKYAKTKGLEVLNIADKI